MKQFIKLHLGLIKYLNVELRKKRTPSELVHFLGQIGILYWRELIKLIKNAFLIFDPSYRKQKKEYKRINQIKVDLQRALKMLQYIDTKMEKQGVPRWKRQQFWRDFFKFGQVRKEMFDDLMKEIK